MTTDKIPIICIVGPTASGKTDLSIDIAKKLNGEIVSADSMQVYKEFNISTAKPTSEQLSQIKHHIIGIVSVKENFSVSKYKVLAQEVIKNIYKRGKIPILCGGTGFYIDSLIKNIPFEVSDTNFFIRDRILGYIEKYGPEKIFDKLKKVDPISAESININDHKRICRAIEFYYANGFPIRVQVENSLKSSSCYDVCKVGLGFKDRDILYERINKRVDLMLQNGILDEISAIKNIGNTAKSSIGYKELLPFINGQNSLDECVEKLKRETRKYAKRQITWFKRDPGIKWFNVDEYKKSDSSLSKGVWEYILNQKFLERFKNKFR